MASAPQAHRHEDAFIRSEGPVKEKVGWWLRGLASFGFSACLVLLWSGYSASWIDKVGTIAAYHIFAREAVRRMISSVWKTEALFFQSVIGEQVHSLALRARLVSDGGAIMAVVARYRQSPSKCFSLLSNRYLPAECVQRAFDSVVVHGISLTKGLLEGWSRWSDES